jgi:hypothetical protein
MAIGNIKTMKPTEHAKELREHFLEQIAMGERPSFTSRDATKILIKAKQNIKS